MTEECGAAVVLTLESTRISACSCGSLVSKGRFNGKLCDTQYNPIKFGGLDSIKFDRLDSFKMLILHFCFCCSAGFCVRLADDFEVSWDDWKPGKNLDMVMNAMVVPEGTYEVCSRTQTNDADSNNAKWILNVQWQMRGIDVHLNTNIGKRLSALGNTLTSLTGEIEEEEEVDGLEDTEETESELPTVKVEAPSKKLSALPEGLPDLVYDSSVDPKTRARLIEKEMNEQAKVVQDLKQLGAKTDTIECEEKKLQELETAVFQDFRQDIMKKLKRQSVKATAIRDKLGLGYKPAHIRSKSTGTVPHAIPPPPRRKDGRQERMLLSCREDLLGERGSLSPPILAYNRAVSVDLCGFEVPKLTVDGSPKSTHSDFLSSTIENPCTFTLDDTPITPQPSPSPSFPTSRNLLMDVLDSSSDSQQEVDPELAYLKKTSRRYGDFGYVTLADHNKLLVICKKNMFVWVLATAWVLHTIMSQCVLHVATTRVLHTIMSIPFFFFFFFFFNFFFLL